MDHLRQCLALGPRALISMQIIGLVGGKEEAQHLTTLMETSSPAWWL